MVDARDFCRFGSDDDDADVEDDANDPLSAAATPMKQQAEAKAAATAAATATAVNDDAALRPGRRAGVSDSDDPDDADGAVAVSVTGMASGRSPPPLRSPQRVVAPATEAATPARQEPAAAAVAAAAVAANQSREKKAAAVQEGGSSYDDGDADAEAERAAEACLQMVHDHVAKSTGGGRVILLLRLDRVRSSSVFKFPPLENSISSSSSSSSSSISSGGGISSSGRGDDAERIDDDEIGEDAVLRTMPRFVAVYELPAAAVFTARVERVRVLLEAQGPLQLKGTTDGANQAPK